MIYFSPDHSGSGPYGLCEPELISEAKTMAARPKKPSCQRVGIGQLYDEQWPCKECRQRAAGRLLAGQRRLESVAKLPFNAEESSFAGGAGLSTTRHAGSCDGSGKARFDRMVAR